MDVADDIDSLEFPIIDFGNIGVADKPKSLLAGYDLDASGNRRSLRHIQHPGDYMLWNTGQGFTSGIATIDFLFGDVREVDGVYAVAVFLGKLL